MLIPTAIADRHTPKPSYYPAVKLPGGVTLIRLTDAHQPTLAAAVARARVLLKNECPECEIAE